MPSRPRARGSSTGPRACCIAAANGDIAVSPSARSSRRVAAPPPRPGAPAWQPAAASRRPTRARARPPRPRRSRRRTRSAEARQGGNGGRRGHRRPRSRRRARRGAADRDRVARTAAEQRRAVPVQREPGAIVSALERADVDARARFGLGGENACQPLPSPAYPAATVAIRSSSSTSSTGSRIEAPTMEAMAVAFSIGFAVAIVMLAASFASRRTRGSPAGRVPARRAHRVRCRARWIALAFEPDLTLAVAAAGLTVCAFAHSVRTRSHA